MPRNQDSDIRVVTLEESQKMSEVFSYLANTLQIVANSFQRQAAHNLGMIWSSKDKPTPKIDGSVLTSGVASRIIQSGVVTYPCLRIRKVLEEKEAPQYAINFTTAFMDTLLGVPLEVNGSIKTLKLLGVEVAKKDLLLISAKSFVPFFFRNQLSWYAINSASQDDFSKRVIVGALSGAASTVFHNIGTETMKSSLNKSWEETCSEVLQKIKSDPAILKSGWKVRSASIAGSTFLLSSQTTEFIVRQCQEIFGHDVPSQSPKFPNSGTSFGRNEKLR